MTPDQPGQAPPGDRTALERAFLEIARERYPDRIWTVDRDPPPERREPDTSTTGAKMGAA